MAKEGRDWTRDDPDELREGMPLDGRLAEPSSLAWHMWGGVGWAFSRDTFLHPFAAHPSGPANYLVQIRLERNSDDQYHQPSSIEDAAFIGDSEIILRDGTARDFAHAGGRPNVPSVVGELIVNDHGRIGALRLVAVAAARMIDAYRMAQTAFNRIAIDIAIRYGVPLRHGAMLLVRIEEGRQEFAIVSPIGYPNVEGAVRLDHPAPMARMYANYAEALRSASPFYAFLCFFSLVEFLTGPLQGWLRLLHRVVPIGFENLAGKFSAADVRNIGKYAEGLSFTNLIANARPQRNAVAHFLMEMSSRPFDVVAEDGIAFQRDLLKIAARRLLEIAERNARRFLAAGISERTLTTAFEGRFWPMSQVVNILQQRLDQQVLSGSV